MKLLEKQLKALANGRRLDILKLLQARKTMDVGSVADTIKLSFKATSKHLAVLYSNDVVDREQRGVQMYYKIASDQKPAVSAILKLL